MNRQLAHWRNPKFSYAPAASHGDSEEFRRRQEQRQREAERERREAEERASNEDEA
jgi:hypothetical protein